MDTPNIAPAIPPQFLPPVPFVRLHAPPTHGGSASANGTVRVVIELDHRWAGLLSDTEWAAFWKGCRVLPTTGAITETDGVPAITMTARHAGTGAKCCPLGTGRRYLFADVPLSGLSAGTHPIHVAAGLAVEVPVAQGGRTVTLSPSRPAGVGALVLATITS